MEGQITWTIPDDELLQLLYEAYKGEVPEMLMLRLFAHLYTEDPR